MFNRTQVITAIVASLGLAAGTEPSVYQQAEINAKVKRQYVDHLIDNGIIPNAAVGNVVYHTSFPTTDPNYMEQKDALKQFGVDGRSYNSYGMEPIEKLLRVEFHTENATPVAVAARPASRNKGKNTAKNSAASNGKGRTPGSKNRDKATVEAEKAIKQIRVEGRKELGLPPRGRLTDEQTTELEKYVNKHTPKSVKNTVKNAATPAPATAPATV